MSYRYSFNLLAENFYLPTASFQRNTGKNIIGGGFKKLKNNDFFFICFSNIFQLYTYFLFMLQFTEIL